MAQLKVGILVAPEIKITLHGVYTDHNGNSVSGDLLLTPASAGDTYTPTSADCCIEIHDVIIGVNFHWERRENQKFRGGLTAVNENGKVTAVNIVDVEDYLESVISSEMSATASLNLLKAHAIISRSWVMKQIEPRTASPYCSEVRTDTELVKWYDHVDHTLYDVCADDHCQRYQGITRAVTPLVAQAVRETAGVVLMQDGKVCDARFSKCCGGVFEEFQNCWEPERHPYLIAQRDTEYPLDFPDLTDEATARQWILSKPASYCNCNDPEVLSQVLNDYDQETHHFYRWTVEYTQDELAALIRERSGIDFGAIIDLQPVERGTSARLTRLRIVGQKRKMIIGKELEIRRTLSTSHLYSSAFVVERHDVNEHDVPARFTLHGAGWGHGVGLCQIGAAVMGHRGIPYDQILQHYFPGSALVKM